ncbi:hypothetical protein ACNQ1T_00200 [Mycoplasma sp. 1932B]|uniref:hypothetical protein n=1 Tax=Mycoplasma sp. 1932B TaxID=3401670 RepID=UPI003AAACE8A
MNKNYMISLKKLTIANILLTIIPAIILAIGISIRSASEGFSIVLIVLASFLFVATFVIFVMLLVTTGKATTMVSNSDNKILLWVSFIVIFFIPLAAWVINFVVIWTESNSKFVQ